ncbi:nucleotidylyl transferase superfamily protein [Actinidia rufa]|uniref:Nucleotidylyl transferase superfamily protein n=1 Tax=Actinidia rufa TaxID=165716 RepID=A0A7J0GZ13_9ERIC|nr:nucleotidylyl transferase superfamily protein [Actinidia rufa]
MTDGCLRALVEAIHSSPTQAVLYLSGGASQALGLLMSVPGASNTVLEAVVPYSRMSMVQLLGKVPTQFAGRQTSEDMALLAYNRALKLSKPATTISDYLGMVIVTFISYLHGRGWGSMVT